MEKDNSYFTFIQEVKAKSNIVDVARRYIDLERKGNKYWARCPIHNEKTPSFTISEELGSYHCFGCGASGDVIAFVMAVEHCDFKTAVKMLAERANIPLPEYRKDANKEKYEAMKRHKERLYMLMRESAIYYYSVLKSKLGKPYMDYANSRGLDLDTIKTFGLGCSCDYDGLVNYLTSKGFTEQEMLDSGICSKSKDGRLYDFEAERLIVPIFNNQNKVIAFGGRAIVPTDFMKYKNTQETAIFKKRFELFGVHTMKKAKLTERFNYIIVVEGYMDVIALYQAGIKNVCASMGTALTIEQANLLKHFNQNVYLCYDGDSAGQKATYKGIDVLRQAGLNVKVVTLIEGLDPDEIIKKYGVDKFNELVEKATSPTEYKIKALEKRFDLSNPEGRGKFALEALKVLEDLSTDIEKEAYLPMIEKISSLSVDSLKNQMSKNTINTTEKIKNELKVNKLKKMSSVESKYYKAVRLILYLLFKDNRVDLVSDDISTCLRVKEHIAIYDLARELTSNNEPLSLDDLINLENNSEALEIIKGNYDSLIGVDMSKLIQDNINTLKLSYNQMQLEDLQKQFVLSTDHDDKKKIGVIIKQTQDKIIELKTGGVNGK